MHDLRSRLPLALAALMFCQPVAAQTSAVCEGLRLRLSAVPEVIVDTAAVRRYSSAIARQNLEIRKVRQDMRSLRCDGSVVQYRADGTTQCGELSEALSRMETNRQDLAAKRDAAGRESIGENPARLRLLAALEDNGCNAEPPPVDEADLTPPGAEGPQPLDPENTARFMALAGQGNLRTLCVRTCDGAFFPISSGTSPLSFRRDAQVCEQMCPNTETELFFHAISTEESADMVSAETGEPYRSLPNAFAYLNRQSGEQPACGCDLTTYYRKMRGTGTAGQRHPADGKAVIEMGGAESQAKKGVKPPATAAEKPIEDRVYDPNAAHVRQVGPTFLPKETSSIDLKNPALPGPQPVQQ
ncbi:DUF2865 domain-containing protein [Rhizobium sp. S-51]|uniref:DUF2865 domain-containing protein n=1 Tax=Rhizobium terricola TaxID=2728849 RepID=A0A7Y0FUY3_9HYPH|nr:DUF2865 domain-containing protein [Rhizobium terricola]NML73335.1 DUF2865 domain-containing protein [Rhizobium terricola]